MLRTRFKKDIVTEFMVPSRPSKKVIIFAHGMPGLPCGERVMEFWSKKGFWVFSPRYRGTWESGGEFLRKSPHLDILDVIDELPKGFADLWTGQKLKVNSQQLFVMGGSF